MIKQHKTALITGVTDQDVSYLSEFLLEKKADVESELREYGTKAVAGWYKTY